ncbi:uncharacterized protein LOC135208438 [Macrobrachium nipponense]|uniref:uncharacterized protein LOC135208438 n=1 Tax=Macrobrachium nipponense TaxID=159736 RepID=UPI0030C89D7B
MAAANRTCSGTMSLPTQRHRYVWTSFALHGLLEKVREFRVLWDHTDELFKKTTLKKCKWEEVTRALKSEFPDLSDAGLTADDVQRKFGTLKSTFQRELRKIQCTPSGSAGAVEPKWEYFKSCSFMIPVNSCTPRRTSFDTSEPQEPETLVLSISSEHYEEGTSNSNWGESDGAQPQVCNIPDLTPPQTRSTSSLSVQSDSYFDGTHASTPSSSSSISQRSDTRVKKRRKLQCSTEGERFDNILDKVDSILNEPDPSCDPVIKAATNLITGFMLLV